jgi:integrase/recombinase XerD
MAAANIVGPHATPRGLRHGFGVKTFQSDVPPHLVQRWLGHASLRTTSIYDVMGPDERAFAERMCQVIASVRRAMNAEYMMLLQERH